MFGIIATALLVVAALLFLLAYVLKVPAYDWIYGGTATLVGTILFACGSFAVIQPGTIAVQKVFGSIQDEVIQEGFHTVNPFADLIRMSILTDSYEMSDGDGGGGVIEALAQKGQKLDLDVTTIYHLNLSAAPWVLRHFGRDYLVKILKPSVRTGIRVATSKFTAEEAYSEKRQELAEAMATHIGSTVQALAEKRGFKGTPVYVDDVLIRRIGLPKKITAAIEAKLQKEQEAQAMQFVLQKETDLAEKRRIEAAGIRDFQEIVSSNITEDLLRWKGIEATENLAKSTNAKTVIIGGGGNGLPIILNTEGTTAPVRQTAAR